MNTDALIEAIPVAAPEMQPVMEWLIANDADISSIVERAKANLHRQRRNLPRPQLVKYCIKAVLNEFFRRWLIKHRGQPLSALLTDAETKKKELHPFDFAMMRVGDERTFRKIAPQFVRAGVARRLNVPLKSAEDFSAFVFDKSLPIADLFLRNFDPSRKTSAVAYLEKTAVSLALTPPTGVEKIDRTGLESYLKHSKRLKPRTILALKLAYVPLLLTKEERRSLRTDYGFKGTLAVRLEIQTIAQRLGFPNAAALSRKLYKVCQWCERHTIRQEVGGRRRG